MYIKIISNPPIIIINIIIGYHDELFIFIIIMIEVNVCIRRVNIIVNGVLSVVDKIDVNTIIFNIIIFISVCGLKKIIILEIIDIFIYQTDVYGLTIHF